MCYIYMYIHEFGVCAHTLNHLNMFDVACHIQRQSKTQICHIIYYIAMYS